MDVHRLPTCDYFPMCDWKKDSEKTDLFPESHESHVSCLFQSSFRAMRLIYFTLWPTSAVLQRTKKKNKTGQGDMKETQNRSCQYGWWVQMLSRMLLGLKQEPAGRASSVCRSWLRGKESAMCDHSRWASDGAHRDSVRWCPEFSLLELKQNRCVMDALSSHLLTYFEYGEISDDGCVVSLQAERRSPPVFLQHHLWISRSGCAGLTLEPHQDTWGGQRPRWTVYDH